MAAERACVDSGGMRYLIAVFLVSGLLCVPAANAASCPGADPCPWTQFDSFGDVGPGEFRTPYGIGADASGNLYVIEEERHRVQKLDPNGAVLKTWGEGGSGDGRLDYPYDIAVDPAGGVYVTDNGNLRVEKFDTSGKFVSAWGWGVSDGSAAYQVCTGGCRAGLAGSGTGQFKAPNGIATDGVNVYVADGLNSRIQKYDLAGNPAGGWTVPGGQRPLDVAVHGGNVYVTTLADKVWRFDTAGTPDNSWDGDGVTGASGSGPGQFSGPEGIAVDGTGVYVSDTGNERVQKLDSSGSPVASWGSAGSGAGQFDQPYGLVATGGSVWVPDAYNHRLQKFSQAGVHQATVGSPPGVGDYYFPADVAWAPSGDMYVTEAYGLHHLEHSGAALSKWDSVEGPFGVVVTASGINVSLRGDHVSRYDATGGLLDQFGTTGSALGQLRTPVGLTADADGNLYVAEANNNRVQKFSPTGTPLASFGSSGFGDGQFHIPEDVALDAAGNVYVADGYNNRIQKFSPAGALLGKWGTEGSGDGQLRWPTAVIVDRAGHVFVSDAHNNRIQEFDVNGKFIAKWGAVGDGPGELMDPYGLTIDADGALWVADDDNHRIVRFCCPAAKGGPAIGGSEQPGPSDPPSGSGGGSGGAPDTTSPHITLGGRTSQRTRTVRRRGLALRVATNEPATVTLRAVVTKRTARRLGLRGTSIGRGTTSLAGDGAKTIRLRLSARARRLLSRQERVRIVVRAIAADSAGNRSTGSLAISARR
ncbi:MAG TPA: 6-bladed beta-propeller [Thermoleophilaceae bacterium]